MKYQIIRMKNWKQQHYNVESKVFEDSKDRWSGEFESTPEDARAIYKAVLRISRRTNVCTLPQLSRII